MSNIINIGTSHNQVRLNHAKKDIIYFLNNFIPKRGSGKSIMQYRYLKELIDNYCKGKK